MEIPTGKRVLKVKILEANYEPKLEFPGGIQEAKQTNLPWGKYGYFLELHKVKLGGIINFVKGWHVMLN